MPFHAGMCYNSRMKRTTITALAVLAAASGAVAAAPASPCEPKVVPFALGEVSLAGGVFKERRDVDADYLLNTVKEDRLLAEFRSVAGLPRKAVRYPNRWEGGQITGHSLGHYLSAVAALYAVSDDPGVKSAAKAKVDYVVSELKACQDAHGNGFLMTCPQDIYNRVKSGNFRTGGFDINGWWVPNYTLHKVFAGLRDAYRLAGNKTALEIARRLADWYIGIVGGLSDADIQKLLVSEWGGLNETFAQLYDDTGDVRYRDAAERFFDDRRIFDPLKKGEDRLDGRHANTQVPKMAGLARLYEQTGNPLYRTAVETFWRSVALTRSFANGGHSDDEHFYPVGDNVRHLGPHNNETCNINNMLRLTAHTFGWDPTSDKMDFVERALYNQLLAQIGRKPGEFGYFLSQAPVGEKVWSTPEGAWWCCVGTGMENPMHYAEHAYYHSDDTIYVNLFMPSRVSFHGWTVEQVTDFPREEGTTLRIKAPSVVTKKLKVKVRKPYWCREMAFGCKLVRGDGKDGYVTLATMMPAGSTSEFRVALPMEWHMDVLPHSNGSRAAFMYGPLVMAAVTPPQPGREDLAKRRWDDHLAAPGRTDEEAPVIVADSESEAIEAFRKLRHMPLCDVYEEHYSVYLPVMAKEEYRKNAERLAAEAEARRALQARIVDEVLPGFQQSEVNHDFTGNNTEAGDFLDRKYRHGMGPNASFAYRLKCDGVKDAELAVTYWSRDGAGRVFDILVDGTPIARESLAAQPGAGRFYDKAYAIPGSVLNGKKTIEVRFSGTTGTAYVGGVFGVKLLRK